VLADHTEQVVSASFSPDGKRVVTASADNTARVWDLSGPTPVATVLAGHTAQVESASFSPDGKRVVTASWDQTARVWDLSGPTPVYTELAGHTGPVLSASFSPDGKRVVTASEDKTARVWDPSGPTPVSTVGDRLLVREPYDATATPTRHGPAKPLLAAPKIRWPQVGGGVDHRRIRSLFERDGEPCPIVLAAGHGSIHLRWRRRRWRISCRMAKVSRDPVA
jgi:hypothetical protein